MMRHDKNGEVETTRIYRRVDEKVRAPPTYSSLVEMTHQRLLERLDGNIHLETILHSAQGMHLCSSPRLPLVNMSYRGTS